MAAQSVATTPSGADSNEAVVPTAVKLEDNKRRESDGPSNLSDSSSKSEFEGAISDIIWAACFIILPMLAVSAVFLALVFHLKLRTSPSQPGDDLFGSSTKLVDGAKPSAGAYLVDIDSTKLITVASWTSTIVSFLPTWVMVLVSYPLAAHYLSSSQNGRRKSLPTPFQLGLIIDLLMGNLGALWSWLVYRIARRNSGRGNRLMASAASLLTISATVGLLIMLADTWLHLTTSTVLIRQVLPVAPGSVDNVSWLLNRECIPTRDKTSHTSAGYCTIAPPGDEQSGLIRYSFHAYKTLYNISSRIRVRSAPFKGQSYAFLTNEDLPDHVAFQASSYAIGTACEPISQACNLRRASKCPTVRYCEQGPPITTLPYHCSEALHGDLTKVYSGKAFYYSTANSHFFLNYFADKSLKQPFRGYLGARASYMDNIFVQNSVYFAIGAKVPGRGSLYKDPEVQIYEDTGESAFLFRCSQTVMDLIYTYADNKLTILSATPSNASVISAITSPWLSPVNQAKTSLDTAVQQAGLADTVQDIGNAFGLAYSRSVLSMGIAAVIQGPAMKQATVRTRQVTRLPIAPFYTLIGLNCLYATMGLALAFAAFAIRSRKVKPVQARLSVTGLVAALFEGDTALAPAQSLKELFSENDDAVGAAQSHKVAVAPTDEGGWKFREVYSAAAF